MDYYQLKNCIMNCGICEDDTANYDNKNKDNHNESAMILDTIPEAIKAVSKPKITLLEVE